MFKLKKINDFASSVGHSHQDTSRWAWCVHREQMFLPALTSRGHAWRLCLLNPCSLEDNSRVHLCSFAQMLEHLNWVTVQYSSSVMSNSLWPHDCSMPGLPVHHQLPEFTQTHVHWVGDAIQPSHPLSSPSPPAFNLSQHQGLFQWVWVTRGL